MLVAMATGTGKTFTAVNQCYRLLKSKTARRILFLVDRRALAAQAVRAFSVFEPEPNRKFDQIFEVYSNKFQKEDFGDDEPFDPKVMPRDYLLNPQPKHTFVYVCTIQRMAIEILGRQAVFSEDAMTSTTMSNRSIFRFTYSTSSLPTNAIEATPQPNNRSGEPCWTTTTRSKSGSAGQSRY